MFSVFRAIKPANLYRLVYAVILSALVGPTLFAQSALSQTLFIEADAGADQIVAINTATLLDGSASVFTAAPDEAAGLTYAWSVLSGPADITFVNAASPRPEISLPQVGQYEIRLTVTGSAGKTSTDDIVLTTPQAGSSQPPRADAGSPRLVTPGVAIKLDGSASVSPNGTALSYNWTLPDIPEGSIAALSGEDRANPQFTPDIAGNYTAQLRVTDETGAISDPVRVSLSTANIAPIAMAGRDRTAFVGETLRFDPQGTFDANGDALSVGWTLLYSPPGSDAQLTEDEGGRQILTPAVAGDYIIQVHAKDPSGAVSYDTVSVYAFADAGAADPLKINLPPVANAGRNQTITNFAPYILDGSRSTDTDGDRLTYAWSLLSSPQGSIINLTDSTKPLAQFIPDTAGPYVFQLQVTDAQGARSFDSAVLTAGALGPVAVSGGPDAGADGKILDLVANMSGQSSVNAQDSDFGLNYAWSLLDVPQGEGLIAEPDMVDTGISFTQTASGAGLDLHPKAVAGLGLLGEYNLISFGDLNTNADTQGRVLVGRNVVGGSATFATGIHPATGVDVLEVVGDIKGGPKNINNGGDVKYGGRLKARLNLNGGGKAFRDYSLNISQVLWQAKKLSYELCDLSENSVAHIPTRRPGPAKLNAMPDDNGVAVFHIPNGNKLFKNKKVQQIEMHANGAQTIIINVGGRNVNFNKGNFVGAITSDDVSSKIIWNFHEAHQVKIFRGFEGSILAPHAFVHNKAKIDGSVIATRVLERARIGFPLYSGTGLVAGDGAPVKYALVQLSVTDTAHPEQAASYDSTVLTTGNLRPLARIAKSGGNGPVTPGTDVNLSGAGSSDGDNDTLVYKWSILSTPVGSVAQLGAASGMDVSLTPDIAGQYIVQLIVSDGELSSRPVTFAFEAKNGKPTAIAGADQSVFKAQQVVLNGTTSSDPDADELSYIWTLTSSPAGSTATLSDPQSGTPSFTPQMKGDYVFSLIVNDGTQNSEADSVTVSVVNRAPLAAISGTSAGFAGDMISLSGMGSSDPDGDALTYIWALQGPDGSNTVLSDTTALAPMFTPDAGGTYAVTLRVSDGDALSAPASFSVSIDDANRGPVLASVGNQSVNLGSALSLTLSASDPDGDSLSYYISPLPLPAGAMFDASSGVFSFRPGPVQPVQFSVTFGVTDGLASDSETISISVAGGAAGATTDYSGRVVDGQSGAAIVGAIVTAGTRTTTTDSTGNFTLLDLPVGTLIVCVESGSATQTAPGGSAYASVEFSVNLIENVENRQAPDIKLISTLASAQIVTGQPTILEDSDTFGVRLEIPADSISGLTGTDIVSLSGLTAAQANQLPQGVEPCQLFAIEPKSVQINQPISLTVDNYDGLPAGAGVDIWVLRSGQFMIVGSGSVTADGDRLQAQISDVKGGEAIALTPARHSVTRAADQSGGVFVPSTFGEGNLQTSYSVPGYTSLGVQRAVSLIYNSDSVNPEILVSAQAEFANNVYPQTLITRIDAGGTLQSFEDHISISNAGPVSQQAIISAADIASGRVPFNVLSTANYGCSRVTATLSDTVYINNQSDSPFGAGWTLPELQVLDVGDDGVTIIDGTGVSTGFSMPATLPLEEGFDDGFGGWEVLNDVDSFTFETSGGNPGGYLEFVDAAVGAVVYWKAPDEFANRIKDYAGGKISYDLQQSSVSSQFNSTSDIVIETGPGGPQLKLDFPTSQNPGTAWTSYSFPLTTLDDSIGAARWLVVSPAGVENFNITEAEFQSLLSQAVTVLIRAEYRAGPETAGIDNVNLRPAPGSLPDAVDGAPGFVVAAAFEGDSGDFSRLFEGADGTYIRRYPNGTQTVFNAEGRQSQVIDRNGNTISYAYDSSNRVSTITDATGLITRFNYVGRNLSSIVDPAGKETFFAYDTGGNLTRVENPEGEVTAYGYDQNQKLISKTDRRGLVTSHSYGVAGVYTGSERPDGTNIALGIAKSLGLDTLGTVNAPRDAVAPQDRVTRYVDSRGNESSMEVNGFGAPVKVTDALGRVTFYERNDDNLITAIIAPSSVTASGTVRTEMDYDANGYVIAKREAVGTAAQREQIFEYEPQFARVTRSVDAGGFETLMEYDASGNMIAMTDPLGAQSFMSYDSRGLMTSQTDKNGNVTSYSYDSFGRLERTTDANNVSTRLVLTPEGNVAVRIDAEGTPDERRVTMGYDSLNRMTLETAGDGGTTAYVYNENDDVVSVTDPTGVTETRSYDDRNRVAIINDPATGATVFTYDADSNVTRLTDALGETTDFTYDAVDRLLSSVDAKGQLRAFAYDVRDNITGVTDARANLTLMSYDVLDRPLTRANPKGETWQFSYDARDNRLSAVKPDGTVLTSVFDGLSRLTSLSGGDIARTYAYDAQDNLTAANDNLAGIAGAQLGFTYDNENRVASASVSNLLSAAGLNNTFTYGYDALDRRASMSDSFGGNTAYAYDNVDRLTSVTTPQSDVFTVTYDLAGRTLGRTAPNATQMARAYEIATGRASAQTHSANGSDFNVFDYSYTDRGNIAGITETGTFEADKTYTYDELERLTDVTVPDAPLKDEAYTLDPEGNRITSHLSGTHTTDSANRLTEDADYTYVYDLNGNLTGRLGKAGTGLPQWGYTYSALDELLSVTRDGAVVERYRYDAFGRRSLIETANDNTLATGAYDTIAILNDGSDRAIDAVADTSTGAGAGAIVPLRRYTHSDNIDEPLQLESFDNTGAFTAAYTYHADHLGSVRFLTDAAGTVISAYDYDSYGRPQLGIIGIDQPFAYTGREWDEASELYHYRARAYDPGTGRFLQEDPIGFAAGDLNVYRYVGSNPLSFIDPSGLSSIESSSTNGISSGSAPALANIGLRISCTFTALGAVLDLAGTPDLATVEVVMIATDTAMACGAKATFRKPPKKRPICKKKGRKCFAAGTLVHTIDGLKSIEDIKIGDRVKAMDPQTGEVAYKRVLNTHQNRFDPIGLVSIKDETDGSEMHLSVTATHPFYHAEKGWTHASQLFVGDKLFEDDGGTLTVTLVAFNQNAPITLTYNLEVADFHTYFVGEDGVLVHNGWAGKYNDKKLQNIMDQIIKREKDLDADGCGLPEFGPGPDRTTRQGHRRKIKELWNQFYKRLDKMPYD